MNTKTIEQDLLVHCTAIDVLNNEYKDYMKLVEQCKAEYTEASNKEYIYSIVSEEARIQAMNEQLDNIKRFETIAHKLAFSINTLKLDK